IGDRVQALGEAVRFTSILPDQLRELAILVCARHWRANYEWYAHAKIARAAGLPEPVIEAVMVKSTPPAGAGPEGVGAIYAFARALNENGEVGDGEFTAAMDLLGERGIVELTILVGYYGLISKLLNTFEKPVPAGEVTPFPR
ncbi:MAG: carboxymuconolactone decarboxylase family protein, partial [Proteobacteria bacterium]|nr:carboxymuconolactone decarboxylase family protein [Pseudomonadota bacterium]